MVRTKCILSIRSPICSLLHILAGSKSTVLECKKITGWHPKIQTSFLNTVLTIKTLNNAPNCVLRVYSSSATNITTITGTKLTTASRWRWFVLRPRATRYLFFLSFVTLFSTGLSRVRDRWKNYAEKCNGVENRFDMPTIYNLGIGTLRCWWYGFLTFTIISFSSSLIAVYFMCLLVFCSFSGWNHHLSHHLWFDDTNVLRNVITI